MEHERLYNGWKEPWLVSNSIEKLDPDSYTEMERRALKQKAMTEGLGSLSVQEQAAIGGEGRSAESAMSKMGEEGLLPTQIWIHAEQLAFYREVLKNGGKVKPIEAYRVNGRTYIQEGHHRYLAGQLEGVEVEVIIHEFGGPVGLPDWSKVELDNIPVEFQPINTENVIIESNGP